MIRVSDLITGTFRPQPVTPGPPAADVVASPAMPLPWRRTTPWHLINGARSMTQAWPKGASTPSQASPMRLQFDYSGAALDRVIGFVLEMAKGGSACDVTVQELNTGWFLDFTYDGSAGVNLGCNVETLESQVNLVLWFSTSPGASALVSFYNFEIAPYLNEAL